MSIIRFKVSVVAINTHSQGNDYYGPPRANMFGPPANPNNIRYINQCITRALFGGMGNASGHIVMLPEFILQPREGAYTAAQRTIANAHLQGILTALPAKVLVVFGTMVSEALGPVYYNEMPYGIGGGTLRHTGERHLSNIDLTPALIGTLIGWHGNPLRLCQDNGAVLQRVWGQAPGAHHTVRFLGVRFGFSVCLDYDMGVLPGRLPQNVTGVHVHLVSSCGMAFRNRDFQENVDHNATLPKGAVVICDAQGDQSSIHRIKKGGTSFHRSSMKTKQYTIAGIATKIRQTIFLVDV